MFVFVCVICVRCCGKCDFTSNKTSLNKDTASYTPFVCLFHEKVVTPLPPLSGGVCKNEYIRGGAGREPWSDESTVNGSEFQGENCNTFIGAAQSYVEGPALAARCRGRNGADLSIEIKEG